MRLTYHTLDVFTEQRFGGNPLAVFPDAERLEQEGEGGGKLMQRIATELNLSETVFVLPAKTTQGTKRVRIFTPGGEVPFAGHPTIGTAFLLAALGYGTPGPGPDGDTTQVVLEEGVGPVPVTVGKAGFSQLTAALPPELRPAPLPPEEVAALVSLTPTDLDGTREPQAASCGLPFLIVPLRDHAALAASRVNLAIWERRLADSWSPQLYLISANGAGPSQVDFRVRCFCPGVGVPEDPATGSAAAAFAGYLALHSHSGTATANLRWTVEQGIEMGRPSLLQLEADLADGAVSSIRVGGHCVLVAEASMQIS